MVETAVNPRQALTLRITASAAIPGTGAQLLSPAAFLRIFFPRSRCLAVNGQLRVPGVFGQLRQVSLHHATIVLLAGILPMYPIIADILNIHSIWH